MLADKSPLSPKHGNMSHTVSPGMCFDHSIASSKAADMFLFGQLGKIYTLGAYGQKISQQVFSVPFMHACREKYSYHQPDNRYATWQIDTPTTTTTTTTTMSAGPIPCEHSPGDGV
jgi:hypothetical protein